MEIMREITDILDKHCAGCPVKSTITKHHGQGAQDAYCTQICKTGIRLAELGLTLEYGSPVKKATTLNKKSYLHHQTEGMYDKDIAKLYGISKSSLVRRKRHWGVFLSKSQMIRKNKTKKEYMDLKAQSMLDTDICKLWGIGQNGLCDWKKKHGIRGGL